MLDFIRAVLQGIGLFAVVAIVLTYALHGLETPPGVVAEVRPCPITGCSCEPFRAPR